MSRSSRSRTSTLISAGVTILCTAFLAACGAASTVDAGRTDTTTTTPPVTATLEIGNWNLEWFGDPSNGPANDTLQIANARSVIAGTGADIWGLVEVVTTSAWNTIKSIPGYDGVLANDASVAGGTTYYSAGEQKPACLFKTSVATLTSAELILTSNQADFAGRPPLECKLHITAGTQGEDLVVIVQHMKAFDDLSAYNERLAAAADLKAYLDATYPTQRVIVIGDWNDDIDQSITVGKASPYANFMADSAHYAFATKDLTAAHVASTVDFPDMIDHQLATNEMYATFVAGSAKVLRPDQSISGYGTTTSDHYPVVSQWNIEP